MQYQHEVREAVRAELMASGQKGAVGEISKVIAERWHNLPEDEKREYQDRAKLKNENTAKNRDSDRYRNYRRKRGRKIQIVM